MAPKGPSNMMIWSRYSAGALEMGISVVIGLLIGNALDDYLGTKPWMMIFWTVCGSVAGFRSLYRMSKKIEKEYEDDSQNGGDKPSR